MIASALYGDGPRGGIDIEGVFFRLLVTTLIGAAGGGLLARAVRRRYAGNKRRLDQFANSRHSCSGPVSLQRS